MKYGFNFLLLFSLTLLVSSCTEKSSVTGPSNSDSWTEINGLPSFENIVQDVTGLYSSGSGIFHSTDGGETWIPLDTTLEHGNGAIAVIDGAVYSGDASYSRGIFLSTDHGSSWTAVDSGLGGQVGNYPAVSCLLTYGANVFAGTYHKGVFRTLGNPQWTAVNTGLYTGAWINCFAVSGYHIFAGTQFGVYLSIDDGSSWTLADSGFITNIYNPSRAPFIVSFATEGSNVFAGTFDGKVFVSTNYGTSWANVTDTLPTYGEFNVWLAATDSSVFVGCDGGMFASTNNGSSWTNITGNLPSGGVGCIAVVGKYLLVNAGNGVWRRKL